MDGEGDDLRLIIAAPEMRALLRGMVDCNAFTGETRQDLLDAAGELLARIDGP